MSLQATLDSGVPRETAAVAHAAFPRGHAYLKLRDALGPIHADIQFAGLFARVGQPAACPWRLARITLLQFPGNLSDRRAADAGRARIDRKYLLGLDRTDPGFPDVHDAEKRATTGIGYKVHLPETCDDLQPPLIVHVATPLAPVVERAVLDPLHAALATKDLLPARHLVAAAYVAADGLVAAARDHDIALTGPVPKDNRWQARTEGAFTIEAFHLDWNQQIALCPAGHSSRSWHPDHNLGRMVMRIRFAARDCRACNLKPRCTRSERRLLTPRSREEHATLAAARARETSRAFAADRRRRAGIEDPLSRGVRATGLRRSGYPGLAGTHLQHLLTATAINLGRLAAWIDDSSAARTRRSAFARLMAQPTAASEFASSICKVAEQA